MDRERARRLLGLAGAAGEAEVHAAYWALRAHVEARAHASASASFRAERARELRTLDEARRLLAPPARAARGPVRAAWLLALGALALSAALILALLGRGPNGAARGPAEPAAPAAAVVAARSGEPSAPAEPARLAVRANLQGARFALADPDEGPEGGQPAPPEGARVRAAGPADGAPVFVPAGVYDLAVRHPDCPDVFRASVSLAPGQAHEVEARVCAETGFLVVRSEVADDRLFVDGELRGATGPKALALPAGEHRVRVEKPGYTAWSTSVELAPAERTTLRAELRPAAAPPPASEALDDEQLQSLREGYTGWHAAVRQRMLASYDADGSGRIDRAEEVRAIPCSEWNALERAYEQGGLAVPMSRLYGFDGSIWLEGALGFAFGARDLAYERMRECGLR